MRTPQNTTLFVGLLTFGLMIAARAETADLQARIVPRPLTPGDKTLYGLPPSTEVSGGLSTIAVGAPLYLEVDINNAIPATDILGVTWTLTNQPINSLATFQASPVATNVPVYEPSDQLIYQVAARTLLRPDVTGAYTVIATISTASEGTTNVFLNVTAANYVGINTCALCHSGGLLAPNKVDPWQTTAHSTIFTKGIDGNLGLGAYYSQSCLACHTVGFDTNTNAVNGGFDDVMAQQGWTFPTVITNGNWAAMPHELQDLANVQCENCHGPGSEHASALGNTNAVNWPRLSITTASGDCNQCHDAPTHHIKGTEWYQSAHAVTTRDPAGNPGCVICHTSDGFIARISGASSTNTSYSAIGCQTCHEPHGQTTPTNNPHLLRTLDTVALMDGTIVTNFGEGKLCMNCHKSRRNATNYVETAAASVYFGPHEGPQADMIMGVNAITYGKTIPSSAHRDAVTNGCVACHMQTVDSTEPSFLHAGGHTFKVMCDPDQDGTIISLTAACQQCHGASTIIDTFDFPLQDYDGNGVIEGVQTEVQNLLDQLALLLPPVGVPKSDISIDSTWTRQQLRAGYNYRFVQKDGSMGIHNTAYAVGLLKASIADLTGVSSQGGLPDAWVIQYFGSLSNPASVPNATPAGDGIPNWVKYALGLDPTVPGTAITNGLSVGVVWANGKDLVNPPLDSGLTNAIAIYTAAEVAFNTESNTTYQIQGISSLGGGWQNIGDPIQGTGSPTSYVTPTRQSAQMFFRVVHTP